MIAPRTLPVCALVLLLGGCTEYFNDDLFPQEVRDLAKSDIDFVMEAFLHRTEQDLQQLMRVLYEANPKELARRPDVEIDDRIALLLPRRSYDELQFGELNSHRGVKAMELALEARFVGDRVFALMVGITSQMRVAYGDNSEFFPLDQLDPTNLHNFATNLEILREALARRTHGDGSLLLEGKIPAAEKTESATLPAPTVQQLLDNLVGSQRTLILIVNDAQRQRRISAKAVRTSATVVLLPLSLL